MASPVIHPVPNVLFKSLDSHSGSVNTVIYCKGLSPKYALSGGQDRKIKLWNRETGIEIKTYSGHGYEVTCLDVAHDNAKFVSSGGDRTAFLWDVTSGETIRRLSGHGGRVNAVALNADASVLASGSFDSTVRLWDLRAQSRQVIQVLDDARDSIMCIYIGRTELITGSVDGYVRSYDLRKGQLSADLIGHPVTSVTPTEDAQSLLVTTLDSTIRLMDRANGQQLNSFTGHTNKDYSTRACFGYGQSTVICGDEEGRIWVWDLVSGAPLGMVPPVKSHDKLITSVAHHPSEMGELLTSSADGTVKIWRTA